MSTRKSKRSKKRKKNNNNKSSVGPNDENFRLHRELIPNLKFQQVPIVDIDVIGDGHNLIKTSNFIDKVSEYSQRPDIIKSGGFFIMRPPKSEKYRYLIDPQKIANLSISDKHYFINNKRHNSNYNKPLNKDWVYDIPQLSKNIDNKPLFLGSYPQKTEDVLTPLFIKKNQKVYNNESSTFSMTKYYHQIQEKKQKHRRLRRRKPMNMNTMNSNNRKRKRNERDNDNDSNTDNKIKRRRVCNAILLPKQLTVPPGDNEFDLTLYLTEPDDIQQFEASNKCKNKKRNKETFDPFINNFNAETAETSSLSDIASIGSNDTGSHSFPTSTSSFNDNIKNVPLAMDYYGNNNNDNDENMNDREVLSTNIDPIEINDKSFDVGLWNKLLSKRDTTPPITVCDMAIDNEINNEHKQQNKPEILQNLPSLDMTPETDKKEEEEEEEEEEEDIDINNFRGFAFVVNQSDETNVKIEEFWPCDFFEEALLNSPYDAASAEQVPLIFASDVVRGCTANYGIIGNNVTLYEERSPLDLINLSIYGPFAEFVEGGIDNEYMEGIQSPYIYLGNTSTWFAWHREDMNLFAVNHLLWGNDKLWYCIPPNQTRKVLEFVRKQYAEYCGDTDQCLTPLQHKQFWFDPYILLCMGINVYFFRQKPGDIMITPPGGLHCGLNTGPNMAESLNFMVHHQQCWKTCLSAMHFSLFNPCKDCQNSVWIDFHELAKRCRNSKKCNGKLKKYAPSTDIVPSFIEYKNKYKLKKRNRNRKRKRSRRYQYDDDDDNDDDDEDEDDDDDDSDDSDYYDDSELNELDQEEKQQSICRRLTEKERKIKQRYDPIKKILGERLWVYPVRPNEDNEDKMDRLKYWYPAVWVSAAYSYDDLQFEIIYQFKYLDSGTLKGRNEAEYFSADHILWDKGLLIRDWNRRQRFKTLTETDYKIHGNGITKKYSYPRRQGNMLLNYDNINHGDYKNLYYLKCKYYQHFPEEIQYKELYKSRNAPFRTYKEMKKDIDEQHRYFCQPLISDTEQHDDDDNNNDDDDDIN